MNDTVVTYQDRDLTADEILKKMSNADQHIDNIEGENAALRNQIEELKKAVVEPPEKSDETEDNGTNDQSGLSVEDVVRLAREVMVTERANQQSESNSKSVDDYLTSLVGNEDQVNEVLKTKASELGVTEETLVKLKAESPDLVKSWFKPEPTQEPRGYSTTQSVRNTLATNTGEPKEGSWAYWRKMRRDNPKLYNSPQMSLKRHEDAKRAREEGREF